MKQPKNIRAIIESATAWAYAQMGRDDYRFCPLKLIEDAVEYACGAKPELGAMPRDAVRRFRMSLRENMIPPKGALVLYEMGGIGYCALSMGSGDVIHAWRVVREDHYLIIPHLTPFGGLPYARYLGWIPMERMLQSAMMKGKKRNA